MSSLPSALSHFVATQHIRNVLASALIPMLDADGNVLVGIQGRVGVSAQKPDGSNVGLDFMQMEPGSSFPVHVHEGDHELFVLSGEGVVHINGFDYNIVKGDMVHIFAKDPHGVRVPGSAKEPLAFLAFGHPHKALGAYDRMRHPDKG